MNITILYFGDIVGKIGRRAIREIVPVLRKKYNPDVILANVENLAHGKGITKKTLKEISDIGINLFTSGNHIFRRKEGLEILTQKNSPVLRPANYPIGTVGTGERLLKIGAKKLLVLNLMGRVFVEEELDCPFRTLDEILNKYSQENLAGIIIDFHAEATSEKVALGWYTDGKVSAVLGTHTHIPTADAKILPKGTAYITDIGMVGPKESVLGVRRETIIDKFLYDKPIRFDIPEQGTVQINAVLLTIDSNNQTAINIKWLEKELII